jgi:hypothetical protein
LRRTNTPLHLENGLATQQAFCQRAKMNGLARNGTWDAAIEESARAKLELFAALSSRRRLDSATGRVG